jgi:hypothetical protein
MLDTYNENKLEVASMVQFTDENELGHNNLTKSVCGTLEKSTSRLKSIEETLNDVTDRCNEILSSYSAYDEIIEIVSAAVSSKANARLKTRLAEKFHMNPMPKSQRKFSTLAGEAEAFLRVSEHHLKKAEAMLPNTEMKM